MIDKSKLANAAMNEEELDNVAGGTCGEIADDSRFLNSLNGSTDRYGAFRTFWGTGFNEIKNAWASLGIETDLNCGANDNKYYLNGQEITQEQARQHAMKVTGHYMTESDWKW